jgi:DNA-binding MarR family transcriptional regulator
MAGATRRSTGEITQVARAIQAFQRLRASRQVHGALMAAAGVDLSQQAVQVLTALADGQSVAQLAAAARMDMGAVSRQLAVLEDGGYLVRAASPDNGTVVIVSATRRGREAVERITTVRDGHLTRALASWSPDERTQLAELLQRLVDDLQATPYPTD